MFANFLLFPIFLLFSDDPGQHCGTPGGAPWSGGASGVGAGGASGAPGLHHLSPAFGSPGTLAAPLLRRLHLPRGPQVTGTKAGVLER